MLADILPAAAATGRAPSEEIDLVSEEDGSRPQTPAESPEPFQPSSGKRRKKSDEAASEVYQRLEKRAEESQRLAGRIEQHLAASTGPSTPQTSWGQYLATACT